jgi:hypothetical protein
MTTSELAQVEALVARVLPDPAGFIQRVLQQMVDRLSSTRDGVADTNLVLAAALGACDCWGQDPECAICSGDGSAGWTEPDARLYAEYVEPAARRYAAERSHPSDRSTNGRKEQ